MIIFRAPNKIVTPTTNSINALEKLELRAETGSMDLSLTMMSRKIVINGNRNPLIACAMIITGIGLRPEIPTRKPVVRINIHTILYFLPVGLQYELFRPIID